MLVHITYDGATLTMNLLDLVTNKNFVLTQAINIPQIVGSNMAYVGFTGSTGGLTAIQKILSWTYSTQALAPVTSVPVFSPQAGSYSAPQNVALSSATAGAVIYYTTNGTTPTTSSSSTVYSMPIAVTASETIEAIAVAPNAQPSSTAIAAYTIQSAGTTINFPNGFSSTGGLSLKGTSTVTNNLLQLTSAAAAASAGAAWFTTPVNITGFTTDFNFQLLSAKADGFTFAIQNAGVAALGPNGSGLGYGASHPGGTGGIPRSVALKFDLYNNNGEGCGLDWRLYERRPAHGPSDGHDCFRSQAEQRRRHARSYHV